MNKHKEKIRKIELPKRMKYMTARGWVFRGESNAAEYDFARRYEREHPRQQHHIKVVKKSFAYSDRDRAYKKDDRLKKKIRLMSGRHCFDGRDKKVESYVIYKFDNTWAKKAESINYYLMKEGLIDDKKYEEINRPKWIHGNAGVKASPRSKVRWRKIYKLSLMAAKRDQKNGTYLDDGITA